MSTVIKIKEAALTLFAEKGYEATTLNDIAKVVGIKKPSLYVYFTSKQDLFLTVFEDLLKEYQLMMEVIVEEAVKEKQEQMLFLLFQNYILRFTEKPTKSLFWSRMFMFPPQDLKKILFDEITKIENIYLQKESEIIDELIDSGKMWKVEKDEVLLSFRSLREGMLMAYLINPQLEKEKIKNTWEIFWFGLKRRDSK